MYNNFNIKIAYIFISICSIFSLFVLSHLAYHMLYSENAGVLLSKVIPRAYIYDANNMPLAVNIPEYSLYVNKQSIGTLRKNKGYIDQLISDIQNMFHNKKENNDINIPVIKERIQNNKFAWIKRNLTPLEYQKYVQSGGITGINIIKGYRRFYPYGRLVSDIVGITDSYNYGISGIEKAYNHRLLSQDEKKATSNSEQKTTATANNSIESNKNSIKLNIVTDIQKILYDEIKNGVQKHHAHHGIALVADIKNSKLIGAYSYPDFNPNKAVGYNNTISHHMNDVYEIGSIMKIFTVALALEHGISLKKKYYVSPSYKIDQHIIRDFTPANGLYSMYDIFLMSSNIGIAKIVADIGYKNFVLFMNKLGFTERLISGLQTSHMPMLPPRWSSSIAQIAGYGYGIAITPMHVLKAFCAIINGGLMRSINTLSDNKYSRSDYRIVSKRTSKIMTKLLRDNVRFGTGKKAYSDKVNIGGKTGTTNIVVNGVYDDKNVIASFISAFPTEDPKYAMLIIIYQPKPQKKSQRPSGGSIAAPIVSNIISRLMVIL